MWILEEGRLINVDKFATIEVYSSKDAGDGFKNYSIYFTSANGEGVSMAFDDHECAMDAFDAIFYGLEREATFLRL